LASEGELHEIKHDAPGTGNDYTLVEGNVNGDGVADFQIQLTGLITLAKADFVL
jgi:serralysin